MALFSKKEPCPICGGKIDIFFPRKIEGQLICDSCYGKLDVQQEVLNSFTMDDFKNYLNYYQQNQQLKEKFHPSFTLAYSVLGNDMVFDFDNQLFCTDEKLNKLIISGKDVVSLTIKEDNVLLFECTPQKIQRYESHVPAQVLQMAPQLVQMASNQRLLKNIERATREEDKSPRYIPPIDLPEPFEKFCIHLKLNHPYWQEMFFEVYGPTFSNEYPDANDYLQEYTQQIANLESFVGAFAKVSFAQASTITSGTPADSGSTQAFMPPVDAIEEIKKYKVLMEEGVLTQTEFESKKKQLLGI